MRHRRSRFKLNMAGARRRAMIANMAVSLATYEEIETTITRAKFLRPFFESLVTIAKNSNNKITSLRLLKAKVKNNEIVALKILNDIAPRYSNRQGGYLRIIRIGLFRKGDGAELAKIELV